MLKKAVSHGYVGVPESTVNLQCWELITLEIRVIRVIPVMSRKPPALDATDIEWWYSDVAGITMME